MILNTNKQELILNFDCPVDTNLQLGTSTNNTGLFRNNTGANYPYDIGGALSITESSAGVPGYYYYYYNIQVEIPCVQPNGCTDSLAINFDALATIDDGSCQYCDISATIIQSNPTNSTTCDGYIFGNISSSYSIISTQISDFNTGQILSNNNGAFGLCSGVYIFEVVDVENCIHTEIISLGKHLWMY